jgi:predicted lipoprotein
MVMARLAPALLLVACGQATEPPLFGESTRRAILASATTEVILPTLTTFEARATALREPLEALAAAPDSAVHLEAARRAWAEAMDTWQAAELMQLGPAAPMSAGGEDLRAKIYSWPLTNPCRVDQETAREGYTSAFETAPVNVRGLDALEWLLFAPDTGNACPPQVALNADGLWASLSDDTIRTRRAAHAKALGVDLIQSARALREAWDPAVGNFARELSDAGLTDTYRSAQEGLNALSDAMFYLEKEGKDMKLAVPLGLVDCPTEVCPEATESPLSKRSLENLRANARTFRALFLGAATPEAGTGFDDLLRELGADSLADTMLLRIEEAIAALDAIPSPLETALLEARPAVDLAYARLRALADILKTELLTVLDLELPDRAEGDND